jgi:hypothetical protein
VLLRINFELLLSFHRPIDLNGRDCLLFYEPVGDNSGDTTVKEIQHPILLTLQAHAQLLDSITQKVRFRPAELVAEIPQSV